MWVIWVLASIRVHCKIYIKHNSVILTYDYKRIEYGL